MFIGTSPYCVWLVQCAEAISVLAARAFQKKKLHPEKQKTMTQTHAFFALTARNRTHVHVPTGEHA